MRKISRTLPGVLFISINFVFLQEDFANQVLRAARNCILCKCNDEKPVSMNQNILIHELLKHKQTFHKAVTPGETENASNRLLHAQPSSVESGVLLNFGERMYLKQYTFFWFAHVYFLVKHLFSNVD